MKKYETEDFQELTSEQYKTISSMRKKILKSEEKLFMVAQKWGSQYMGYKFYIKKGEKLC